MNGGHMRLWLFFMGAFWTITGASYAVMSGARRWAPQGVAALGFAAAVLVLVLALRPYSSFAYRMAGTFAIGALVARMASLTLGEFFYGDLRDYVWITIVNLTTAFVLVTLYGWWWLHEVGPWHECCRKGRRDLC